MLCPYRTKTMSYERMTNYKDEYTSYPVMARFTETNFDSCYKDECQLYDKVRDLCLLGRKQYGT